VIIDRHPDLCQLRPDESAGLTCGKQDDLLSQSSFAQGTWRVMTSSASIRFVATQLLVSLSLPFALLVIYLLAIRPIALHWGSTAEERTRAMPGDSLVPSPSFCATRAITIEGSPKDIWPWLVQMGYGRAGFYGYDLIENAGSKTGIHSLGSIEPALEHPKTGDVLPISAVASLVFDSIQPDKYLIWRSAASPSDGSFTWALFPVDGSHTRLISRIRLRYHWKDRRLLLDLFTEFADHVAVPRILQGIKDRVEGRPPQSLAWESAEIMTWVLALAEFATAVIFLFCWRHWRRTWSVGLAAGLVLLFVLYVRAPVWIGAALVCGIFGAMLRSSWMESEKPEAI